MALKKKLLSKKKTPVERKYKNLREVIDMERNFSMLYSGVEDDKNFHILYDLGIRNFLMSYHYVQKKNLDVDMYLDKGIKFLIDSGAYTYINSPDTSNRTVEEWEQHIIKYLAWARQHKDIIFAIASLDIEQLVGGDQVQEWNEKYFEPFMLETGIPVVFVWHQEATKLSWEKYCQRYPYVGVSWGTDAYDDGTGGLKTGQAMLKIAEKYNTVVHGMAMTRTSLLTKLPFYTVDSTTWMVGVQYGEVNWWRGTKMSRLKKDKWKGEMLDEICNTLGRDRELLLAEDPAEMIKVNVQAFMKAEAYIQSRAKSKLYWLKPRVQEQTVEDLEFPPVAWLDSPDEDWIKYAKAFNINTELDDKQVAMDLVVDITALLNWDEPEYAEFIHDVYTPELIKQLHDCWINQIVENDEQRIEDLQNFFRECVEGKNDRLLIMGTNFDRVAKERDKYIEEETEELIDLTPQQLAQEVGNLLPPGEDAPEIDELDDEIFSDNGLVAVRDEKGRFLKGQKKVKKPKNIYSEKYPKLVCNTCYASQNCPEFKAGYVCAFNKMFKRFDCRNTDDVLEAMQGLVNLNSERLQRVAIFEMLDGGMPDGNLTMLIDQQMRLLSNIQNVNRQVEVQHTKTVTRNADGSVTETSSVKSNQPNILERMFMMDSKSTKTEEELDKDINNVIEAEDVKVE